MSEADDRTEVFARLCINYTRPCDPEALAIWVALTKDLSLPVLRAAAARQMHDRTDSEGRGSLGVKVLAHADAIRRGEALAAEPLQNEEPATPAQLKEMTRLLAAAGHPVMRGILRLQEAKRPRATLPSRPRGSRPELGPG